MACFACLSAAEAQESVGFSDKFRRLENGWHVADYNFSHPDFATDWRPRQVDAEGGLSLSLDPQPAGARFFGGSLRRKAKSHYGIYEVLMQPARGPGLVTGFFTYTGPHYDTQHDEIDIEFLGKDTTRMQVGWFIDGRHQSQMIDLGFDAADGLRHYAFKWCPERLRWYVEGQSVFDVDGRSADIPRSETRLFLNLWAASPGIASWAGRTTPGTSARARIAAVRYTPLPEEFQSAALKD